MPDIAIQFGGRMGNQPYRTETVIVPQEQAQNIIRQKFLEEGLSVIKSTTATPEVRQAIEQAPEKAPEVITAKFAAHEAARETMIAPPIVPTAEEKRLTDILARPSLTEEQRAATESELAGVQRSLGKVPTVSALKVEPAPTTAAFLAPPSGGQAAMFAKAFGKAVMQPKPSIAEEAGLVRETRLLRRNLPAIARRFISNDNSRCSDSYRSS
jgi:hypothetical protein